MTQSELQIRIRNAKDLDFGSTLTECIDLFKKVWVQGLLTVIILVVLSIPVALLSQFFLAMVGVMTPTIVRLEDFNFDNLSAFYGFNLIYNIPFAIITASIQIAVLGGFYRMIKMKEVENSSNDDYFYFFKKEYFGKILLLGVIYSLTVTVAQFMCFIPYIYAIVPLMFLSVVFAFNSEKSVEDIMKASFQLGNKKWLLTFGCLFVCGILAMLGLIACCIGILFTFSIVYLPTYVIYRNVIGFDDTSELNQIGIPQEY